MQPSRCALRTSPLMVTRPSSTMASAALRDMRPRNALLTRTLSTSPLSARPAATRKHVALRHTRAPTEPPHRALASACEGARARRTVAGLVTRHGGVRFSSLPGLAPSRAAKATVVSIGFTRFRDGAGSGLSGALEHREVDGRGLRSGPATDRGAQGGGDCQQGA
jgi:hypothetical protein